MKGELLMLRLGSGVLALGLFLLSPVLRAEEVVAGKPPGTNANNDSAKDGTPETKESSQLQEPAAPRTITKDEMRLKILLAKYDANGDGQLDEGEKKKLDADLAKWAKMYKQALAKYDLDKNGVLDREEKERMRKDDVLADRNERKFWLDQEQMHQKMQQRVQQMQRRLPPRDIGIPSAR